MSSVLFPIRDYQDAIPEPPHLGAFGAVRKYHRHEGVDLYTAEGTKVYAVEPGIVVAIMAFTGPGADSPWWNDTMCVMVEGASGVINYGEVFPSNIHVDQKINQGDLIGWVKQVLIKDKGRPMSMLHFELYIHGTKEPVEWEPYAPQPKELINPTPLLKKALNG